MAANLKPGDSMFSAGNGPKGLASGGKSSEETSCWAEHRKAVESSKVGNPNAYIPECRDDGRFQEIQCFKVSI